MAERVIIPPAEPTHQSFWRDCVSGLMRDGPVVHFRDILRAASLAAERVVPFLLVRLGDGEAAVMAAGDGDFPLNQSHVGWPPGWHMDAQALEDYTELCGMALDDADAIGMIWSDAETTRRVARAAAWYMSRPPRAVCSTLGFREPAVQGLTELEGIVRDRHVLCIGMGAICWSAVVAALGGKPLPWPHNGSPCVDSLARYEDVRSWALAACATIGPGAVALVALGPWALPLCHDLWREGAVALDLGSGLTALPDALPVWRAHR